jgi:hypothetical protein
MWLEIAILMLTTYPHLRQMTFTMQTTNLADVTTAETDYFWSDVMLSLMFFRFYFLLQAALVLSPIEKLSTRRICYLKGFDFDVWFQIRANFLHYPFKAMTFLIVVSVTYFALLLSIYERPYH